MKRTGERGDTLVAGEGKMKKQIRLVYLCREKKNLISPEFP